MLTINKIPYDEGSAGALVQWLKPPAGKVEYHGFEHYCGLQISKKQNVSFPLTRNGSILSGTH